MYRLTATYMIKLPKSLRVVGRKDELIYSVILKEFDVRIELICDDDKYMVDSVLNKKIFAVDQLKISVSRDESSKPPAKDEEKIDWFSKLEEEYRLIAVEAINRLIRFFKYEMKTPKLQEFNSRSSQFYNPVWNDKDGNELSSGSITLNSPLVLFPPGPHLLSEKDFDKADDIKLQYALNNDVEIDVYKEFLSDAQTSILDNKSRRAVLELAISCEVAVKGLFFSQGTPAGTAYEYLEDKGKIRTSIIELISGLAKFVFGKSFKEFDPSAYEHIDYLFRARNKVAHRGKLLYRDKNGSEHQVDRSTLENWWASVDKLMGWIDHIKEENNLYFPIEDHIKKNG
ncbi:hypothetical protein [Hydrogenimonas sp.]